MDEDPEGHEFALRFMTVDCQLPREGVLVDLRLLNFHLSKIYQIIQTNRDCVDLIYIEY